MVDGSNESLYYADEEMHPLWQNNSPSQTIFKNYNVYKLSFEPSTTSESYVTFYVVKVTLFRPKVIFLLHKSYTLPTEVVYGSNESLYYPDEELGPYLKTGSLL